MCLWNGNFHMTFPVYLYQNVDEKLKFKVAENFCQKKLSHVTSVFIVRSLLFCSQPSITFYKHHDLPGLWILFPASIQLWWFIYWHDRPHVLSLIPHCDMVYTHICWKTFKTVVKKKKREKKEGFNFKTNSTLMCGKTSRQIACTVKYIHVPLTWWVE